MWFLNSNEIFLKGKGQNRKKYKGFPKEVETWGSNIAFNFLPRVVLNICLYLSMVVGKQYKWPPSKRVSRDRPFPILTNIAWYGLALLYQTQAQLIKLASVPHIHVFVC